MSDVPGSQPTLVADAPPAASSRLYPEVQCACGEILPLDPPQPMGCPYTCPDCGREDVMVEAKEAAQAGPNERFTGWSLSGAIFGGLVGAAFGLMLGSPAGHLGMLWGVLACSPVGAYGSGWVTGGTGLFVSRRRSR